MSDPATSWQSFFDQHAPHYMQNPFTGNTRFEVDFLLQLFELPAGSRILDMGCGTGRHAVELARRGMRVTGVDISAGMLAEARKEAQRAGVEVEWLQADATRFEAEILYDAVICLCEGGFGLVELNENPIVHDLAILRNLYGALRPNGKFVLTALNGYSIIRQMTDEHVAEGRFDPATMVAVYQDEWDLPEGKRLMTIKERLFTPPELVAMLTHVGFTVDHVWGGTAGEWGQRPVKLDEVEAMYVCRKL
jgi:2-polyprenyl-3-methyl-5-hydroxy-6-metoxy-1,4-benzoquinol methylase